MKLVSIHATRVGGDLGERFLADAEYLVSIHATRVGGDESAGITVPVISGFYPRHPCGWRQQKCTKMDTLLRKSVNFSFQFIKNKTTKKIHKKLIEHYIFGCLNCLVRSP